MNPIFAFNENWLGWSVFLDWRLGVIAFVVLILVGSPFQRRYLALKVALLSVKLRKLSILSQGRLRFEADRLGLQAQIVAVSCQLAVSRLHLRYQLLKHFIVHKSKGGRVDSSSKAI